MRLPKLLSLSLLLSLSAAAAAPKPSDFPLRVAVLSRHNTNYKHNGLAKETQGVGRGNLFQNGEPAGFDFEYTCEERVDSNNGFSTYPARWKKPGKVLSVLVPEADTAGKFWTCDFKVTLHDFVYWGGSRHVSIEKMKDWMQKRQYDPEHDKMPVGAKRSDQNGDFDE